MVFARTRCNYISKRTFEAKAAACSEQTSIPEDFERTVDDDSNSDDESDPEDELIDLLQDEEQEHAPEAFHISSDRKVKTIKKHINYRFRGKGLKDINLWLYTALIDIRKKIEENKKLRETSTKSSISVPS